MEDGADAELWGYFQVRTNGNTHPQPRSMEFDLLDTKATVNPKRPDKAEVIDLMPLVDIDRDQVSGNWSRDARTLQSPKAYGSRIEIPYQPPEEYELVAIAEPLDDPNGLILGQRSGDRRFLVLLNYEPDKGKPMSAIENIDGKNVGANPTTVQRQLFARNRLSQIVCTVRKTSIRVTCDGQEVIDWQGTPSQLGLSDYWKTPNETALFLGAYNCRYRFHRVTIQPLSGTGKNLRQ
jgi:hypothetical protein